VDIGKEDEPYTIEPIDDPVPTEPVPAPAPEPVEEPELVPA
jgi:hypothetical protein